MNGLIWINHESHSNCLWYMQLCTIQIYHVQRGIKFTAIWDWYIFNDEPCLYMCITIHIHQISFSGLSIFQQGYCQEAGWVSEIANRLIRYASLTVKISILKQILTLFPSIPFLNLYFPLCISKWNTMFDLYFMVKIKLLSTKIQSQLKQIFCSCLNIAFLI